MVLDLFFAGLTALLVFLIYEIYEIFNLVQIPPEEDGSEEDERQAIVASMSRQHLR